MMPQDPANRLAVLAAIRAQPGLTFRGVVRVSGIAAGTAGHHVAMLERAQHAWTIHVGFRRLHFPGPRPAMESDQARHLVAALDELDRSLLGFIAAHPGAAQGDVVKAFVPRQRSSIQHRLGRLVKRGFVATRLSGRYVLYTAVTDVPVLAMATPAVADVEA